ncbi:site-specific DNA-methyltransferase [Hymenobacter ruber]
MPDACVDFVITSPPYNKAETTNGGGLLPRFMDGYEGYHDNMPFAKYVEWQQAVLVECWRVIKPTGAIFYNHKPRPFEKQIQLPTLFNPGLPLRQVVIWHTTWGVNMSPAHFCPSHEWIMVFAGPAFNLRNRNASAYTDVWRIAPEPSKNHPAPFPLALARRILCSVGPGGIVLDPFMGSGTTAIAAVREGYQYIGIEQNAGYIKLAEGRLQAEAAAPSLFTPDLAAA